MFSWREAQFSGWADLTAGNALPGISTQLLQWTCKDNICLGEDREVFLRRIIAANEAIAQPHKAGEVGREVGISAAVQPPQLLQSHLVQPAPRHLEPF